MKKPTGHCSICNRFIRIKNGLCRSCAQGIEAQRAETVEQGSVHESPVGEQPMRPKDTA